MTKHARCHVCDKVFECRLDEQRGWEFPWHEDPKTRRGCEGVGTVPGQGHSGAFVDEHGHKLD